MVASIKAALSKPHPPDEEGIYILEDTYSSGKEWTTVTGESVTNDPDTWNVSRGDVMTPPENPTFGADVTLNYYGKKIKLDMGFSYVGHKQHYDDYNSGFRISSLQVVRRELNDDQWEEVYEFLMEYVDEYEPDVPSHAQEIIDKAEAPFREAQFKRMRAFQQGLCPSCGGGLEYEDAFNGHVCVECETEYFDA